MTKAATRDSTETLTKELERRKDEPKQKTVLDLLTRTEPEVAKLLPSGVTFERLERTVRTELRRTPLLMECVPESLLGAVMLTAQLQLEPGPLGLVYLVPFKKEVTLIVGYRGYIELAYRSDRVKDIYAELVHEGDTFSVARGTSPKIVHEPSGPPEGREIVAAYAVARLRTGGTVSNVIYPADWEKARKASPSGSKNAGPWKDELPAMIRKTALRRLEPWLPKTPAFGAAVTVDEQPALPIADVEEAVEE